MSSHGSRITHSDFLGSALGRKLAKAGCEKPGQAQAKEAAQSSLRLKLQFSQATLAACGLGVTL
jgi:hypothetical protein